MGYLPGIYAGPAIEIFECIMEWDAFNSIVDQYPELMIQFNEENGCLYLFPYKDSEYEPHELILILPKDVPEQIIKFQERHSNLIKKLVTLFRSYPDDHGVTNAKGERIDPVNNITVEWATIAYNKL